MNLVNEPLSQQGNKYEVFLSYSRDKDAQEYFPSHLYSSLRKAKIRALKDDVSIEGCEISIIIFSKHYASSKRCLEELTRIIMAPHKSVYHVVLPIFYGVDPSEVCNLESSFGKAFQELIQTISPTEDEVSKWRYALNVAGRNYGFFVPDFMSNNESEVIQNVVERVCHILNTKGSFDTDGLVGLSSKVQEVVTMLEKYKSKGVVSIGIWGMGGSGKTTLASVIFDHIKYEFESTCFVSNVRRSWDRKGPELGRLKLKERPWHKKVLIVLDDVDGLEQLHALCGDREWFGEGSRIIITTRNLQLLKASQVDLIHHMKHLNHHESLELFSRTAFKQANPKEEFIELSWRMVDYTQGHPLSLKVVGSCMFGRPRMEWESALRKLSTCPSKDVYSKLRLSYCSLNGYEQEIFLNIVSMYVGEDMNDVMQKLDGGGDKGSIGIRVLASRSKPCNH